MPDVRIKTPNLDDIFEKWKNKAGRTQRKQMEKQFSAKGSVFTLDAISAAEYVTPPALKGAAIYFSIKKTVAASKVKEENMFSLPPVRPFGYNSKSRTYLWNYGDYL